MKPTKEAIIEYLRMLKPELAANGIVQIGLFGSYAKEETTPYSDIDIAIRKNPDFLLKSGAYGYFDLLSLIRSRMGETFHRKIDIFDLDSTSPFKTEIEKEMISV